MSIQLREVVSNNQQIENKR